MLNILTSQNLSNVLVIVTRYFGGILLGTGGLVKAYSSVTIKALEEASIVQKELGIELALIVSYPDLEKMKYYLKQNKSNIVKINFEERIHVIVEMTKEKYKKMLEERENLNFCILESKMLREKFIVV